MIHTTPGTPPGTPSKPHPEFCNRHGDPIDPGKLSQREFLPALSRAGLRAIRFHDLRHTYTALLIAQGENIKFIQSQLGHASIQVTLDRYGHLLPETQTGTGECLDAIVFGVRGQEGVEKGGALISTTASEKALSVRV